MQSLRLSLVLAAIVCSVGFRFPPKRFATVQRVSSSLFSTVADAEKEVNLAKSSVEIAKKDYEQYAEELPVWLVDDDTSEIEVGSSGDAQRKQAAAKAKLDLEMAESKLAEAMNALEMAKEKESKMKVQKVAPPPPPPPPKPVESLPTAAINTPAEPTGPSTSLTAGSTGAFDVGLLILFPVMIGTLLLFLFFPVIGQQLSSSLPPPMS